jgi:hypothetical protein
MESSRKEKLQQLSQALQTEKVRTNELQSLLVAIGEEVQSLRASLAREAPRQSSSEDEQQRMQLQRQVQQLSEENAKSSAEVSESTVCGSRACSKSNRTCCCLQSVPSQLDRLRKELRSRGDLARKLLAEKDDELRRMRDRLRQPAEPGSRMLGDEKSPRSPSSSRYNGAGSSSPLAAGNGQVPGIHTSDSEQSFAQQDADTEQDILQLAKLQAHREEETNRLRRQVQQMTAELVQMRRTLTDKESEARSLRDQLAHARQGQQEPAQLTSSELDGALQDRLTYLKSAFVGFYRSHSSTERTALARVIGAILGLSEEEQQTVINAAQPLPLPSLPISFSSFFG